MKRVTAVILGALLAFTLVACGDHGHAAYRAKVARITAGNFAGQATVWLKITNTGTEAGQPVLCNVGVFSVTGASLGAGQVGVVHLPTISAGASKVVQLQVRTRHLPRFLATPSARQSVVTCV